ncbi:putative fungal specific transcription factor domain-containing protein [Colletotrichum sublineola]|uniref:Putative fungal specific transcription factor domain-containing protein n=1 Tax=Colletotrichum sublineola TaxID=1173701 RepID=A0A066XS05_COLSU|nr:putative fungal specific transcription factor domain-containing protein [Colletotrichum sublineola]
MATPGDRLLGALVTLRLLSSEVFKLLGPRSNSISRQIEADVHTAISGAALVFSQQAAPSGSSCALQSKFLNNVLAKVSKHANREVVNRETNASETRSQSGRNRDELVADDSAAAPSCIYGTVEGGLALDFADDEAWAGIMAEAGFNAQDGVFFA